MMPGTGTNRDAGAAGGKRLRLAIIGAGNRGMEVYGTLALARSREVVVAAVVEPDDYKREECGRRHGIPPQRRFRSIEEFFRADKCAEAVIVANPDRAHHDTIRGALDRGYDLLLEKPISTTLEDIKDVASAAEAAPDRRIVVCHVLRYAPFFAELKRLLDAGAIGSLVSIHHHEQVGYQHFAHSYVRGNWNRASSSSPLVLAKSCHDMDILRWFAGARCRAVSAFGDLSYFKPSSAPARAAERCVDCPLRVDCPFSALSIYTDPSSWPGAVVAPSKTFEELERRLADGPYGRCVYRCDNDMIDHLSASLVFENGVTAAFTIDALTARKTRTVRLVGTKGELAGDMLENRIELFEFGRGRAAFVPDLVPGEHGGGDVKLFESFIECMTTRGAASKTPLDVALESHFMALAAESSRLSGRTVVLAEL